jgi:hypothetical protein
LEKIDPIAIFGILLGLAGIIATIWIYLVSQKRPKIRYASAGISLTGGQRELFSKAVQITYDGKVVKSLTKELVCLCNKGSATLRKEDISQADPLRISFPETVGVEFIRARVVNQVSVELNPTGATVNFDFLKPNEGAWIEILHTGEPQRPEVLGTAKIHKFNITKTSSVPINSDYINRDRASWNARRRRRAIISSMVIAMGLILLLAIPFSGKLETPSTNEVPNQVALAVLAFMYLYLGMSTFLADRSKFPRSLQMGEQDISD